MLLMRFSNSKLNITCTDSSVINYSKLKHFRTRTMRYTEQDVSSEAALLQMMWLQVETSCNKLHISQTSRWKGEIEQDEDSHRPIQNCRHMGRCIITAVDFYSYAAKIFCRFVFPSNHYGYDSRYSFSAISDYTCAFGCCEEVESFTLVHGIGSRLIAFWNICIRVLSSQERLEVKIAEKKNNKDSRRPTPDVIRTGRLLFFCANSSLERVRTLILRCLIDDLIAG
ncbi:hypothetical protein DET56_110263 [Paenibacillus pabuli]|uniref:Uncharacterized protein n=1 Tax=Paenibacillus pabuli TaxID=1472 RepID=A0A855XVI7_9BACL|nr:hypothetical protein DET56_110263 [Paenibacillus pabuli]PXW04070.1 hypothetical protein DEU73_10935 [Paenibacillus taichungensis]